MMRPVILSRPENTAVGLPMRWGGGSTTTSSPGCAEASAGCPGARGRPVPDGGPGKGLGAAACPDATGAAPCCGTFCIGGCRGGAAGVPGGGGNSCDWAVPAPGRLEGGRLIAGGNGCAGGDE